MAVPKEFDCVDVFGNGVSCSRRRWKHICVHAEMVGLQEIVKSIIIKPDFITKSRSYANRNVYYKKCYLAQLGKDERYIRIVIEYNIDEKRKLRGRIITAMACNGSKLGEVLVWRQ